MAKKPTVLDKIKQNKDIARYTGRVPLAPTTFGEKIRKVVKQSIDKIQEYINNLIESLDDVDKRLQKLEELIYTEIPDEEPV